MKLRLVLLLALLSAWMANPASGANTVPWQAVDPRGFGYVLGTGRCASVRFDTTNEANESVLLFIGGAFVTVQSDGDAAGAGASQGDLFACTNADGNLNLVQDTTSCAAWNVIDSDSNGFGDDNTLNGGATTGGRGTDTPRSIAGWIYVDPDAATIDTNEVLEVIVCEVP